MIRVMTLHDYDDVFALWSHTENMGLRSLDDSKEGISMFLKRNPTTNFVAVYDHQIVGAILCGNDGRRGYIYHTVVESDYRNRGIATALIDHAVLALKQEGITRVCLNVMESNEAGKQFWINRGWEKKDFLGFYSKSITDKPNAPLFKL
ncbi:MAG: GNAT family N-acetyltransferase [Clostridia bacterium]|nr:GNAT family N-acetyltransferase [Clostridia bacterium]